MSTVVDSETIQQQVGPLAGVRVLELGTMLAGPYAGRLLGEFGAEIVKVEAPDKGDTMRDMGTSHEGVSVWWPVQSRNKKLITLNLRLPRGQELARKLAASCDVLIENFRPGTLESWGLGPDRLLELNPKLVIARVSGYGQSGPYAKRAGYASASEAIGGLRYINGYPDQAPPRNGISLGDSVAGMFATIGILAALHNRFQGDGRGQVIDASITESCFALMESTATEYAKFGIVREPSGSALSNVAPSNVYKSRDGKWLVIAANGENLWRRLAKVIEREELLDDPRFTTLALRAQHMQALDETIGAWVGARDAFEVDRIMNENGIVCAPVYSIADIFTDPQFKAREMLVTMHDPDLGELVAPAVVPKLSRTPGRARFTGSAQMGTHNDEIYSDLLGMTPGDLATLKEEGVI